MKSRNFLKLMSLALILAALLPGLSMVAAQEEDVEAIELPEVDPLALDGDIIMAGSSTVYPLASAMKELFEEEGFTGTLTVDSIGSGAGFERFCVNAETDIANASRAIKDTEVEACAENDREPIEFLVGIDALAVVVSNDYVDALTLEQLAQIYAGEFTSWDQVSAEWPADPIHLFSPGTDSGTFDFFVEVVLTPYFETQGVEDPAAAAEEAILSVEGIGLSENDNVLVEGVTGDPGAIGYFGFAYYSENSDAVNVITIEGVEPNAETAESGEYPLSRPLFIYSDATIMAEKPQVADFINFFLTNVNEVIGEVGYFPASTEALNLGKCHWLTAMGQENEACAALEAES